IRRKSWLPGSSSRRGTGGGGRPVQPAFNITGGAGGMPVSGAAPTRAAIVHQRCASIDGAAIATQDGNGIAGAGVVYPEIVVRHNVGIGIMARPAERIGSLPVRGVIGSHMQVRAGRGT